MGIRLGPSRRFWCSVCRKGISSIGVCIVRHFYQLGFEGYTAFDVEIDCDAEPNFDANTYFDSEEGGFDIEMDCDAETDFDEETDFDTETNFNWDEPNFDVEEVFDAEESKRDTGDDGCNGDATDWGEGGLRCPDCAISL
nr:lonely Cys domain-containing protein [Ipomoea batatas]